jgi:tetratricopeptide (TPR) repeat protein
MSCALERRSLLLRGEILLCLALACQALGWGCRRAERRPSLALDRAWTPPPGLVPLAPPPPPLLEEGLRAYNQQRYLAAASLLETALERDPENVLAAFYLGITRSVLNQHPGAIAALRRAESLAPGNPGVRLYLALALARSGEEEPAREMLEDLAGRDDPWAAMARGLLRREEGKSPARGEPGREGEQPRVLQQAG